MYQDNWKNDEIFLIFMKKQAALDFSLQFLLKNRSAQKTTDTFQLLFFRFLELKQGFLKVA